MSSQEGKWRLNFLVWNFRISSSQDWRRDVLYAHVPGWSKILNGLVWETHADWNFLSAVWPKILMVQDLGSIGSIESYFCLNLETNICSECDLPVRTLNLYFLFLEDVHRVRVCQWRRYCVYIGLLHVIEYDFNLCLGQGHVIADFSVMTSQSKTIDYKQSSIKFRFKVNGLWVGWIPRNFKIFIFKV